jgi:hypothetical protein
MSFVAELKRRNVFKVGVAYIIVAWPITQVISALDHPLSLPDRFDTVVIVRRAWAIRRLLLARGRPLRFLSLGRQSSGRYRDSD